MKKFLLNALSLSLSLAGMAQNTADSYLGRDFDVAHQWYVGVKYEGPPYMTGQKNFFQPGIFLGYNFTPRLSLQSGLTIHGRQTKEYYRWGSELVSYRYTSGVYIPLTLRYSISKPFRRFPLRGFQPYALAGAHGYLSSFQKSWEDFDNGQSLGKVSAPKVSRAGVGLAAGLGMRMKIISRFSFYIEGMLGPSFQRNTDKGYTSNENRNTISGLLGAGVLYNFK